MCKNKYKIIIILMLLIVITTSCSSKKINFKYNDNEKSNPEYNKFNIVSKEHFGTFGFTVYVLVDNDTKVMYMQTVTSKGSNLEVIVNQDGKPLIYENIINNDKQEDICVR